ncbi:ABC transporter ATP-binding protein [Streptomyces sp. AD55]|uniref:ABC transporter ATP-binding protein n=1 Tax=Streptomyces sp. AD55 TaxID=3242895 RepID=UPI0035298263
MTGLTTGPAGVATMVQENKKERFSAAVSLTGIRKSYGDVVALRDIDLEIEKGSFVTLLGPSGSGKTTLLQVIAGFLQPDQGSVFLSGVEATHVPAHRRGLGLVFQHYALFPHMTVRDNIAYGLRIRNHGRQEQMALIEEYLGVVELRNVLDRYPHELSGGQRQRVALARALVYKPSVVLLDEALGALDRKLRQTLQFTIKHIQQSVGATFIHVTHDQDEALAMSDRIILLRDGGLEQVGTPEDLYIRPATSFAAGFMGETNRLDVTIVGRDTQGVHLRHDDSGQSIRLPAGAGGPASGSAVLCVRPENVRIGEREQPGDLTGVLRTRTFMGDHWRLDVAVGSASLVVKEPASGAASVPEPGPVSIDFDSDRARLYSE